MNGGGGKKSLNPAGDSGRWDRIQPADDSEVIRVTHPTMLPSYKWFITIIIKIHTNHEINITALETIFTER